MDKNQPPRGAHVGVLSTHNRQLLFARFFLMALFLVLSAMSFNPQGSPVAGVRGQPGLTDHQMRRATLDCGQDCERRYVDCLANGGGGLCDSQYDACLQRCLLFP
jgi:hypothetical protein